MDLPLHTSGGPQVNIWQTSPHHILRSLKCENPPDETVRQDEFYNSVHLDFLWRPRLSLSSYQLEWKQQDSGVWMQNEVTSDNWPVSLFVHAWLQSLSGLRSWDSSSVSVCEVGRLVSGVLEGAANWRTSFTKIHVTKKISKLRTWFKKYF